MSSHVHPAGTEAKLKLFGFRIVPADFITQNKALIQRTMFAGTGVLEINPQSGYIHYSNRNQLYRDEERKRLALPQTAEAATAAAVAFLTERYEEFLKNKFLQTSCAKLLKPGEQMSYAFSPVPHPKWVKPVGTFLMEHDKHDQPDHWLCKFQVEIETPDRKRMPIMGSSIDVRIGESHAAALSPMYEVIGFHSQWRPVYDVYSVNQFLEDTGTPQHEHDDEASEETGHAHIDEFTQITYVLSDENVPQLNLLPYEATISGEHHARILPASQDSLWAELSFRRETGKYTVRALILGGSGNFQVHWSYWDPFNFDPEGESLNISQQKTPAMLRKLETGSDLQLHYAELGLTENIWEIALHVHDDTLNNFISKRFTLGISEALPSPPTSIRDDQAIST
jgi:hypothetical protein